MGFCLFNNVAVAATHARARGVERVLIVDFDVHHGNGTQESFYADPNVAFVSLHQFPFYPGTGAAQESGTGDGRGFTVNVPLSAGADDAVYAAAFSRLVAPLANEYAPNLVLLSAGFDAHRADPLAEMHLSAAGYGSLMQALVAALPPQIPIGMVLEGGYDLDALESSLHAALAGLLGLAPAPTSGSPRRDSPHEHELERALGSARAFWHL
jgi:acetoin utilization deacetylase AcuC-like enzyme